MVNFKTLFNRSHRGHHKDHNTTLPAQQNNQMATTNRASYETTNTNRSSFDETPDPRIQAEEGNNFPGTNPDPRWHMLLKNRR
ncbi:hypothetical protein BX600DRAFT_518075 [Xylariales sp. PMI_506]|nr:hypothetical protein BX600DRAFT_518075 [Xylariales sp. PMI_506]